MVNEQSQGSHQNQRLSLKVESLPKLGKHDTNQCKLAADEF